MRYIVLSALALLITAPALAGDRAFYIVFIDATGDETTSNADSVLGGLLDCGEAPMQECRRAHAPDTAPGGWDTITLYSLPETVSEEQVVRAVTSARARRALHEALREASFWMDGYLVLQRSGRRLSLTVLSGEGRPLGRARARLRGNALSPRDASRLVRAAMRPIRANFSP